MKTKTNKRDIEIELLQQKQARQGLSDDEKDTLIQKLLQRNAFLEEQFRLAKHKLFASQNEVHPGQGNLFNEAEDIAELEQDKSEPPKDKPKRKRNTKPFDEHITREVVIHDIDEADKICACCQGELHCMGKDVTEKLVFVPATTKVVEHHRLKYACRGCEQNGTCNTIKQAPPVPSILPKSYATPSLLSQLIISKYQHGLPLYRRACRNRHNAVIPTFTVGYGQDVFMQINVIALESYRFAGSDTGRNQQAN